MRSVTFALFVGIAFLSAGVLGLAPAALMAPPADAPPVNINVMHGYVLGLFPVNVVHSVAHLAIGAWGIAAWRDVANPQTFARVLCIGYGLLAVLGLIPATNTLFGLMPIHGYDVWLHGATAAAAVYFGWHAEVERRHKEQVDRRVRNVPVEVERRIKDDRRHQIGIGD
jgi:hypothetical protein